MANISKIRVGGVDYDIKDQELATEVGKKADSSSLAKVATSGSYNDLSNKPTIPSAVTESTVSGWGFTKNTGTYSKPSTGIPKTDLASAVQTSLGKADTALQSYTEQYKGTVTGVKINGTTKSPSSGVVDLGTVVTDISGKQDKLVSGTNIKTINGTSILGSGDITISGGGGSGEDIRYFTEFTMYNFLNINNYDNSELISAAQNNKIICIPYSIGGSYTGYYISSYDCNTLNGVILLNLSILKDGIEYRFFYSSEQGFFDISYNSYKTKIEYFSDTELSFDSKDNILYIAQEELSSLSVYEDLFLDIGSTIRFAPSEDFVLTMPENTLWANGVMPEIEPHVQHELSLTMDANYAFLAVLTPFKAVE
jgi:hypothetical protein